MQDKEAEHKGEGKDEGKGSGGGDEKTGGSSGASAPSAPKADISQDFIDLRSFLASCCDEEDIDYIMQKLAQSRVKLHDLPLLTQEEMINDTQIPLGPAKRLFLALKKYREVSEGMDDESDDE